MRRSQHALVVLLFAVTLAWPASAVARRSLNKIDQNLRNIEGQLAYYLTTIRPPKRTMSKRELAKRLIDGMVLHRMKDYSRAAIVLMDIVNRFPGTTEANEAAFFLGDSMFQQREFMVARLNFQRVVSSGSGNQYYQLALQRLLELEMRRAAVLGRAKTADPERLKQVAELLRKIEAIPVGHRQPSVEYVRGKYLFFQSRVADALKVFSGLGKSHPYHLQAVYFIGVCHIKAGRLNAAAATYKRLIDQVIFGYYKLKTVTHRRVLQLIIMAGARLAYVRGKSEDMQRAIELYNAIPRKSPYFDDALYERAWAYLKAKRYDRASQALQLLNVANPNYDKADEGRVLLGNLKIRTRDFGPAKAIFREAAGALRPVVRKLRGLESSGIDPKAIFDQLTAQNLEQFDIKIRLPKLAMRWLRKQPEVKRALMVLDDLTAVKSMMAESHKIIRAIERHLRLGSQISRFPALAVARAKAADYETQLLGLRGDLTSHMRDLVKSLLSSTDRAELDRLQKLRRKLAAELKKLPKSSDGYSARVKKMRALIDKIDSNALAIQLEIKNLDNMVKAIEGYYFRTIKTQRVPKAVMQQNLAAVKKQILALRDMVKGLRDDLADNRNNLGIGDSVMAYEQRLRKQLAATLQREQQLTAAAAANLPADKAARKARIDVLLSRIQRADTNLQGVNKRIDGYLAAKRADVVRVLVEEKAKLVGYRQQVALYAPSSREVVGGVALQNFRKVSQMVQGVLVKADVGVLDVVWAIKNLAKGQYEKKESLFMRAMEALKLKYREPRGVSK